MSLYSNLAATALRMLEKFGQDVVRMRPTAAAYDTSTSAAAVTTASATFRAAVLDYGTDEVDGTLVKATDKRMIVEAAALPQAKDLFTIGGVQYSAIKCREINPAGTPVAHEVQIRR